MQDFRQDALFVTQPVSKHCRALKAEGTQKHWPQPGKIMAEKFLSKLIFKRFNNIRGCLNLTVAGYSATGLGFVVTGQLADTPTRGLDDSRTGHLADWSTCGLDNSHTGQVADWTTRGCHRRLCVLSFGSFGGICETASCPVRDLCSPRVDQSARCPVRELAYPRVVQLPGS